MKIFILMSAVDYEGSTIVRGYSDQTKANKECARLNYLLNHPDRPKYKPLANHDAELKLCKEITKWHEDRGIDWIGSTDRFEVELVDVI